MFSVSPKTGSSNTPTSETFELSGPTACTDHNYTVVKPQDDLQDLESITTESISSGQIIDLEHVECRDQSEQSTETKKHRRPKSSSRPKSRKPSSEGLITSSEYYQKMISIERRKLKWQKRQCCIVQNYYDKKLEILNQQILQEPKKQTGSLNQGSFDRNLTSYGQSSTSNQPQYESTGTLGNNPPSYRLTSTPERNLPTFQSNSTTGSNVPQFGSTETPVWQTLHSCNTTQYYN